MVTALHNTTYLARYLLFIIFIIWRDWFRSHPIWAISSIYHSVISDLLDLIYKGEVETDMTWFLYFWNSVQLHWKKKIIIYKKISVFDLAKARITLKILLDARYVRREVIIFSILGSKQLYESLDLQEHCQFWNKRSSFESWTFGTLLINQFCN